MPWRQLDHIIMKVNDLEATLRSTPASWDSPQRERTARLPCSGRARLSNSNGPMGYLGLRPLRIRSFEGRLRWHIQADQKQPALHTDRTFDSVGANTGPGEESGARGHAQPCTSMIPNSTYSRSGLMSAIERPQIRHHLYGAPDLPAGRQWSIASNSLPLACAGPSRGEVDPGLRCKIRQGRCAGCDAQDDNALISLTGHRPASSPPQRTDFAPRWPSASQGSELLAILHCLPAVIRKARKE